jgi:integrase
LGRARSSAGEHCLHTAGVTGSIPVAPTNLFKVLAEMLARFFGPMPNRCPEYALFGSSGHLARYRDERLNEVGASACNRDLSIISHAIRIAMSEWGFNLPGNPAANLRKPPQPKGRTRRLEGDEGQRLMMACQASDNPYLAPLVTLAIETAMRRGELLGLDWDDLRLEQNYVHLALTKNGTSRDVPLSPKARQTIEALPRSISGRVIPIHPEALKGLWHRATRRADITGLRFHDLRHEATTRFFEKGLGVMEVAAITGHKDLRMLQRYVQLRPEDLARKLAWGD